MKTFIFLFVAALAAFAQDATTPKGYYAGGVSAQGAFAVIGTYLTPGTSAYVNAGLGGTMTVTPGIVRTVLEVNSLRVSVLGEAGAAITGNTGFAGALGGVISYDVSKWAKMDGLRAIAVMKVQKTGDTSYPVYGFGLSKSF